MPCFCTSDPHWSYKFNLLHNSISLPVLDLCKITNSSSMYDLPQKDTFQSHHNNLYYLRYCMLFMHKMPLLLVSKHSLISTDCTITVKTIVTYIPLTETKILWDDHSKRLRSSLASY